VANHSIVKLGACCAGLSLLAACSGTSAAPARGRGGEGGAVPVVVAKVAAKDVPVDLEGIGNVEAYSIISVRAQVTGQLTEIRFREGDFVRKADHLFTIDPRPFQAQVDQAEANLKRDRALLDQAEAQLARDAANAEYVQLAAERNAQLNARGIISKDQAEQARSQADATAATVKADKAAVESARAQLVAQQAAVENARVALGYTIIRSPIDGRSGNLSAKTGNLVTAGSTELTTIAQVQPVYVTFAVPAVHLPTIKRHMTGDRLHVIATPQDADAQPAAGELTFVDNTVDPTTDTIKLKATFPNPDHRLWPGQFARVSLRLTMLPNAVVVPTQAVQTGQDGQFIFVVKSDATVEQRPITAGQRVGEDIVINKGLTPGETIVTEGQLRLEPGTRIQTGGGGDAGGPGGSGGSRGRGGRGRGSRS
jgi:multidrug efflux system membrane fusion protein